MLARRRENTARYLPKPPTPESGGRTIVIGAGKAGGSMALAARPDYVAYAPLLILAGELDDWTAARYCYDSNTEGARVRSQR